MPLKLLDLQVRKNRHEWQCRSYIPIITGRDLYAWGNLVASKIRSSRHLGPRSPMPCDSSTPSVITASRPLRSPTTSADGFEENESDINCAGRSYTQLDFIWSATRHHFKYVWEPEMPRRSRTFWSWHTCVPLQRTRVILWCVIDHWHHHSLTSLSVKTDSCEKDEMWLTTPTRL
jgi:hypothetical protein